MGTVYLICDASNNLYKIGVTRGSVAKRLKKLQTGNGTELFLTTYHTSQYPYRIETMLHNHFHSKNELNEWFRLDLNDIVNFRETCKLMEERIEILKDNPFFMKKIH